MRLFKIAVLAAALPAAAQAQDTAAEQRAILAVVDKLFDGMRKADTALMRSLVLPQTRMLGIGRQGDVTAQPVDGWLTGIGRKPATTVYDERTWAPEVKVEGNVAQAWMQYAFFLGEKLNHCGIDAFDLLKVGGEWKILTIMDTRRDTGCSPPPAKHF